MKGFSPLAKAYIYGTFAVGFLLLAWNIQFIDLTFPHVFMVLALCLAASLAQIFKVVGTTIRTHYVFSFVVYSFSLLRIGLPETLLVILISSLIEWLWHRNLWVIALFNSACYVIVMQVTYLVYSGMNPSLELQRWQSVFAIFIGMVAFALLNHLMIGIIIYLARGENFVQSGIFDLMPLVIDLTMLVMGASLNFIWNYNPHAILLLLIPLYLIYSTLRVPALERQTEIDQKTGIFNHNYFMKQLQNELTRADRFDRPLCVIMADLDLLRNINNTYGHLAGDEVLKGVAKILQNSVREYDTVARFGGEEFVILMPETSLETSYHRAEEIRHAIEKTAFPIQTSATPIQVTISMGIAGREQSDQTIEEIIHNADTALYHSKLKGRNRTYVYHSGAFEGLVQETGETRPEENSGQPLDPAETEANYRAAYAKFQPLQPDHHPNKGE
jgi:diguanylate cyclase (GGDEF)-like protein